MARFIIAAMLAVALSPGPALAQVGTVGGAPTPSPLGMTSPLGIGAPQPVAPTGIPLGATEIVPQGTSPGTTPSGLSTNDLAVCSGFSSSVPQASFGAPATGAASTMGMTSSPTGLATDFRWGQHRNRIGNLHRRPHPRLAHRIGVLAYGHVRRRTRRPGRNPHGIHRARSRRPQPGAARRDRHAFGFVHAVELPSSLGSSTSSLATTFGSASAPAAGPAAITASSAFSSSSSTGTGTTNSGGGRQASRRR